MTERRSGNEKREDEMEGRKVERREEGKSRKIRQTRRKIR